MLRGACNLVLQDAQPRCSLLSWSRICLKRSPSTAVSAGMSLTSSSHGQLGKSNAQDVASMQNILKTSKSWDQCWLQELTPWDLGKVTPVVADLVKENDLPTGRALIPGCGSGYDVLALASDARHAIGLDISATAVQCAKKISEGSKSSNVEFVCGDFFSYMPATTFDLILDYTFFCALEPSLRAQWGSKISELLASDGELVTIMFPVDDFEGGPPYAVSLDAYENVLHPHGLTCNLFEENALAVGKRKGREFLGRWRRATTKL